VLTGRLAVHHPAVALGLLASTAAMEIVLNDHAEIGERESLVGDPRADHDAVVRILEDRHPIARLAGDERRVEVLGKFTTPIEAVTEDERFARPLGKELWESARFAS
jgi:hypothetical protein